VIALLAVWTAFALFSAASNAAAAAPASQCLAARCLDQYGIAHPRSSALSH